VTVRGFCSSFDIISTTINVAIVKIICFVGLGICRKISFIARETLLRFYAFTHVDGKVIIGHWSSSLIDNGQWSL